MKRLITLSCALAIAAPAPAFAAAAPAAKDTTAAGSDTSGSTSTGSQPFTGKVTINGSAGKAEATLLATSAVNRMSWQICKAVLAATPAPSEILIVTGYTRPDVSDWLVFDANRLRVARQYADMKADFGVLKKSFDQAQYEANHPIKTLARGGGGHGEGQGLITGAILAFTPPKIALTAISRLGTVIGAIAQSNYETGSIDISLTDNVLADAVAGRLRTSPLKVSLVDQRGLGAAATATIKELGDLHDTQRAFESNELATVPDMLARLKKWESLPAQNVPDRHNPKRDAISVANVKTLEAALQALQAREKVAAANVDALDQALFGAPAVDSTPKDTADAADTAGADAAATAPDPKATKDKSKTTDAQRAATAPTPKATAPTSSLAAILKERAIATALDKGGVLYLKIEGAGGGFYAKQNLWTFFGGMPFYVSAGATVTFDLTDKDDDILTSGSIPLGGAYLRADAVAATLRRDRGTETGEGATCLQRWAALPEPVKAK